MHINVTLSYTSDQRNSLCYKSDVAQSSRLLECGNELSAHLVMQPLVVTLPSVLTACYGKFTLNFNRGIECNMIKILAYVITIVT